MSLAPTQVRPSLIVSDFHSIRVSETRRDDIAVADMEVDMVANMEVDKVANKVTTMVADEKE